MDNNATMAVNKKILDAMLDVYKTGPLNASSVHSLGQRAKSIVEEARNRIRKSLNAENTNVIFTSSGTESNNLAMYGVDVESRIISAIEHSSILHLKHDGIIPVDSNGIIDVNKLQEIAQKHKNGKTLFSIMLANNETGVIQDIKAISAITKQNNILLHVDASQAIGKIPVDMEELGADMLTISAHKFGGVQGAAALIVKKGIKLTPIIMGGGQENGLRSGTQNIAAIHAFGLAIMNVQDVISSFQKIRPLRDMIENNITQIAKDTIIFGIKATRLPNTSLIAMPKTNSETQLMHFDMDGIAVSAGSACSSGKVEVSHVLLAMGIKPEIAKCAIRVSLGPDNTTKEIEEFIRSWKTLYERTRKI